MEDAVIELDGKVVEVLPNQMFRVKLHGSEESIIAHLSGKLRLQKYYYPIKLSQIAAGDTVTVNINPNDMTIGRIIRHSK